MRYVKIFKDNLSAFFLLIYRKDYLSMWIILSNNYGSQFMDNSFTIIFFFELSLQIGKK
jgi:hypothetical protein